MDRYFFHSLKKRKLYSLEMQDKHLNLILENGKIYSLLQEMQGKHSNLIQSSQKQVLLSR